MSWLKRILRIFGLQSLLVTSYLAAYAGALIVVCFVGLSPAGPQIIRNQIARIRIVAETPFTYQSKILTDQKIENAADRIPPVYRLNLDPYLEFERYIQRLKTGLAKLESGLSGTSASARVAAINKFTRTFEPDNDYKLNTEDVAIILNETSARTRDRIIQEALMILREVHREGIYDANHSQLASDLGELTRWTIQREDGTMTQVEVQSADEALRFLRIHLSALEVPREASGALYQLMRNGLGPNIVYDKIKTEERRREVIASVKPEMVTVEEGQTIIEPGNQVNDFDLEQLTAYRTKLTQTPNRAFSFNTLLWERMLMTITILASAIIYVQVGARQLRQNRRPIILSAIVILINVALIRLILEMGDANLLTEANPTLTAVIPYLAPIALGPIIVTILTGAGPGVYVAVLVSIFNALMQGNSMPIMLVSFFSSLVGIYLCRDIQVRTRVVRAGAAAGLTMALCTFFIGLHAALDLAIIVQQMAVGLGVGVFTGIAVVGIIPIFENIFKYTTDISLLELTDFNHPLLRHMQVAAPGSYQHSLMVANLSENAAAAIGANPLACRVCSLFHDIGKTRKPEYFTENQQEGINPHVLQNPSMSALVIKSHVREGVVLARKYKLPKLIIDVIEQHHGTTLVQYFYYKALKQKEEADPTPPLFPDAPRIELDQVNESTYRYEGPKPLFRESAVIFFADSIEAASRSLPKVSPQSIDELLDQIFRERLDDHQLSECHLTFEEVEKIKRSFSFTLLNMLHARVEYPSKKDQQAAKSRAKDSTSASKAESRESSGKQRPSREPAKTTVDKTVSDGPKKQKTAAHSSSQQV